MVKIAQFILTVILKWGEQNHNDELWVLIAGEEFGEVCKAILENKADESMAEIVQLAAVMVSWLECKLRNSDEFPEDIV